MSAWTDDIATRLATLWSDGYSAAECSRRIMGEFHVYFSRNAVIGKVCRMNLSVRGRAANPMTQPYVSKPVAPPKARDKIQKPTRAIKVARQAKVSPKGNKDGYNPHPIAGTPVKAAKPCDIPVTARSWSERGFGECAFPVDGEGAETRSCCLPTGGMTYCASHSSIMYVASNPAKTRPYRPKAYAS